MFLGIHDSDDIEQEDEVEDFRHLVDMIGRST
jgi:hypothetical protein